MASTYSTNEIIDAQGHIWNHVLSFLNSMALKCAIQLGIFDTIHKHNKPMTLSQLANSLPLHPSKVSSLYRLIRLLVQSNFLIMSRLVDDEDEEVLTLTINSQLLLKNHPLTLAPWALFNLHPITIDSSHILSTWFQTEAKSPFHIVHGRSIFEHAGSVPEYNRCLNQAMESDTRYHLGILASTPMFRELFKEIKSLVDVGGGNGSSAKIIVDANPGLNCTVLDLPHVVEGLQDQHMNLAYVGGDMFESIPPADAILLKWILHDWSDDDCVKILKKCKEAIPCKEQGGKIIIMDIVVEIKEECAKKSNAQLLFDMEMMSTTVGGKERTEKEWKQLFNGAGFTDYTIFPVLGLCSLIEIYPV